MSTWAKMDLSELASMREQLKAIRSRVQRVSDDVGNLHDALWGVESAARKSAAEGEARPKRSVVDGAAELLRRDLGKARCDDVAPAVLRVVVLDLDGVCVASSDHILEPGSMDQNDAEGRRLLTNLVQAARLFDEVSNPDRTACGVSLHVLGRLALDAAAWLARTEPGDPEPEGGGDDPDGVETYEIRGTGHDGKPATVRRVASVDVGMRRLGELYINRAMMSAALCGSTRGALAWWKIRSDA